MKVYSYVVFAAVLAVVAIVAWSERSKIAEGISALGGRERWKIEVGNGRTYEIEFAKRGHAITGRVLTEAKDYTFSEVTGTAGGKFVQLAFIETLHGGDDEYSLTRVAHWRFRGERDGSGMKGEVAVSVDKRERLDGKAEPPMEFSAEMKWIAFRQ